MEPIVNKKYKNDLFVTHTSVDHAIGYALKACDTLTGGDKALMITAIQSLLNTFIVEEEKLFREME